VVIAVGNRNDRRAALSAERASEEVRIERRCAATCRRSEKRFR
jgi:hypothetical protein